MDNTHYKAYLIKVVEVGILDVVLCIYVLYQLELLPYKLRVFVASLLEVVGLSKTCL